MSKDSAPEKWIYWEHTRVKHEILGKYLPPWLTILGKYHPRLCYFDGFAGRGEYLGKHGKTFPGSPLIAMQIAEELIGQKRVKEVVPIFIEKDTHNFANLQAVLEANKSRFPHVREPILANEEFAKVISDVLQKVGPQLAPSFFFIDPFGFSGVPFSTIKGILAIPRTEIFFTFMLRDINRFLVERHLWSVFDELYGTNEWRAFLEEPDRERSLRELYTQQLRDQANAKYTWDFRVCADERILTLYYLIHATKHFEGLKLMKGIMYRQGAGGMFAYLGPQDRAIRYQQRLFDDDIPSLKNFLLDRFAGRMLTYDEVLEDSYMDTPFIDKHYREALKAIEGDGKSWVERVTSKTDRGLSGLDRITFFGDF